jgi:hypothetical protein
VAIRIDNGVQDTSRSRLRTLIRAEEQAPSWSDPARVVAQEAVMGETPICGMAESCRGRRVRNDVAAGASMDLNADLISTLREKDSPSFNLMLAKQPRNAIINQQLRIVENRSVA